MSFLKTLFWVILATGFVIFAVHNWQPVSLKLWGGLWLDSKLPAIMLLSFLLGFVPLYIWHRSIIWKHKRKIGTLESASHRGPLDSNRTTPSYPPQNGDAQ